MSRTRNEMPFFDRLLLLPQEAQDPDRRFIKSLFLFVFLASAFVEMLLTVASVGAGRLDAGAVHLFVSLLFASSLLLSASAFTPRPTPSVFWCWLGHLRRSA